MTQQEFKNFTRLLTTDLDVAECMGYAFLNCTERQIVKLINWYKEQELVQTIETRRGLEYQFGKNVKMAFPVKDFEKYNK